MSRENSRIFKAIPVHSDGDGLGVPGLGLQRVADGWFSVVRFERGLRPHTLFPGRGSEGGGAPPPSDP